MEEFILIKHRSKMIENGFFTFCDLTEGKEVKETTFSYSLNLKERTFNIKMVESNSLLEIKRSYLREFSNSSDWNQKRKESSVEKYFLVFHSDFLEWNNSGKLDFFFRESKKN